MHQRKKHPPAVGFCSARQHSEILECGGGFVRFRRLLRRRLRL
jgi:hypothetical protein